MVPRSVDEQIIRARQEAIVVFRLGMKASSVGVHRTLNRPPKGKGWVQCINMPAGMMCRPAKVREAIEHYKKSYEIFPDIVVLNQIALSYEMLGELETAREYLTRMKEQAERENNSAYLQGAEVSLERARKQ